MVAEFIRLYYRKLNVIWNNAFRKIFQCCWRESVSCLFYYCKTLPLSYTTDQRKILFIKRMRNCNNTVVRSISTMYTCIGQIMSKYSVHSVHLHTATIKQCIWGHFVDASVINGNLCIYLVYMLMSMFLHVSVCVCPSVMLSYSYISIGFRC